MITDTVSSFDQDFDSIASTTSSSSAVKFGLFVKTRELKQLQASLREVLLMNGDKRNEWLQSNETLINEMLEDFVSDSTLALDGIQLDSEALQMSMEYVSSLRDVMTTMRSIMDDSRTLTS